MIYFKLEILITCGAITSIIRRNMYDTKFLWLAGLIFKLRMGLIFQYTQLQLRDWCTKYICISNTIFTTHTEIFRLSEDVSNLWLICDIWSIEFGFRVLF